MLQQNVFPCILVLNEYMIAASKKKKKPGVPSPASADDNAVPDPLEGQLLVRAISVAIHEFSCARIVTDKCWENGV